MGSDYDHVGMVVKFEEYDDAFFIDATMDGVIVSRWKYLRKWWHRFYSKVVYRPLMLSRDDEFIETMGKFISQAEG